MALRAQMRKASAGPSPESLLSQLSGYNRAETHSIEGGRSEASRILGKGSHSNWEILCKHLLKLTSCAFLLYYGVVSSLAVHVNMYEYAFNV